MDKRELIEILESVLSGALSPQDALEHLSSWPYKSIDCANLDTHRPLRNGFSEVIYGEGKSYDQIKKIVDHTISNGNNVFGTRVDKEKGELLKQAFKGLSYDEVSRTFQVIKKAQKSIPGIVSICCAGTVDIPVAEEALRTVNFFGAEVQKFYDVGVAGLHRIIGKIDELNKSGVIIVVAGMEGSLPSVVGGMFSQPIIAVPTSIGYGMSLSGLTALMSMLCSCAEGITVVNVDNGFGAGCAAVRILNSYANEKRGK